MEVETALPPGLDFWRRFALRFVSHLCSSPAIEKERQPLSLPYPTEQMEDLLAAPASFVGAELVSHKILEALWQQMREAVTARLLSFPGTATELLRAINPAWNSIGRVYFHLAENKNNHAHPFAFLATYTTAFSSPSKPNHRPLGQALKRYADAKKRQSLLSLLLPVQRAAEKLPWVAGMVESGEIFHPLSWTAKEAYRLLQDTPRLEEAGVMVRVPDWWGARQTIRPVVSVTIGQGSPSKLGVNSLLDFNAKLTLDGEDLSESEWRRLSASADGLVLLKGKWVELNRGRLEEVLAHFQKLKRFSPEGLTFLEGMRLLSGVDGLGGKEALSEEARDWAKTRAGDWLKKMLEGLREPRAKAEKDPQLRATLRPYQEVGVQWLSLVTQLGLGACLADDMGLGKAQPLDAKILTPSGWKTMGEMTIGSQVINSQGKASRVVGVYPQGEKEIFRVTFSDGSSAECCDEHLWLVNTPVRRHREQPGRVLPLAQIRQKLRDKNQNSQHFIPMVAPVELDSPGERPLDPYLLGALLGDGGISQRAIFSTADAEMLALLRPLLPAEHSFRHLGRCDYRINGVGRRNSSNQVINALRALGLYGKRSEQKLIPEVYKLAPVGVRRALLQGLLDTDGHVRPIDNNIEYSSSSRQLAEDVQFLVQSLGGVARIREKKTSRLSSYRMSIILPAEEKPFRLSRKASLYHPRTKYPPARAIVSVEPVGRKLAQCIAVDAPDHLYVTDNFIVTHNTVQLIALILQRKKAKRPPSLIVCPASLLANWKAEIERFAPNIRGAFVHPAAHPSSRLLDKPTNEQLKSLDVFFTSYGMLSRTPWLTELKWDVVALDEAQAIRNPTTKQSQAAKNLQGNARLALTGTPIENRLGDLWSLFDFLQPGLLGSRERFGRFTKALSERNDDQYAPLRTLVRPYLLRRVKTDRAIIADLPDKSELKAYCFLTKLQAALYQKTVEDLKRELEGSEGIKRRGVILSSLMRLKQICNHPSQCTGDGNYDSKDSGKFARLSEICETIASRNEKVLVFTQFREITAPLAEFLEEIFGAPGLVLHGGTPVKERMALVDRFQQDPKAPYFVLSLKAGGTGLNLTAASHVIHFDRWWNPAVEEQATDRAYRIGQHQNVLVHKFLCRGTVEEKIDALLTSKQSLSKELLSEGGEALLTEMSNEELMRVVTLDMDAALGDS